MKRVISGVILFLVLSFGPSASALESPQPIGYFCGENAPAIEGQFYIPQGGCTYLSSTISGSRYGDIYRGTVGSSTLINGHSLGFTATSSTQFGDSIPNPQQGEDLFVAVFPALFLNEFRTFFQIGAGAPTGNNYGFLRFKYGEPPPSEPETPDPVIIIPGILGSEQHNGEWVIDPILHTYDDLIATLDINGYTPEVDLFTFPYNWRKSNVETAILLKQKIDAVKAICECDKVDLVAHSMGGLVARQYIQSDEYDQDVDQLIFLGTPHLGAPKAYLMWEGGELAPVDPLAPVNSIVDELLELMLEHEAYELRYPDVFAYLRAESIDSVKELLPIYDYLFDSQTLRQYPQNYPTNTFLEDLNNNIDELFKTDVKIHNIIGSSADQGTIVGIEAADPIFYLPRWEHGYPNGFFDLSGDHGLIRGGGDNTVPLPSASFVNSNLVTTPYRHNDLPIEAQTEVYRALRNEEPIIVSKDFRQLNAKLLLIKILSPADLLIIDPDNNKVGKENGQDINQIPNAFYTGFNTDVEFVTILNPLDGEYKILSQGTGSGAYTIETNYISAATTTETSFTGIAVPGLITELKLSIDNDRPQDTQIVPIDTVPPIISITSPEAIDYLRSEQLSISATSSDGTGVRLFEMGIDGAVISETESIDLFFQSLGGHTFTATSTDNVGNVAAATVQFRIVATPASTLSDIERLYELGWMIQSVREKLRDKLVTYITKLQQTKRADKFILKDILNELERRRARGLNEQSYQLLKEDITWLINN